jgi:colanic acid/amylovoran biosynthesis glycosyltransferase
MLTVAYLSNLYPSAVEPYVGDEVRELRRRGIRVVTGSVRMALRQGESGEQDHPSDIVLEPLRIGLLLGALWLGVRQWPRISSLILRILLRGREGPLRRVKALVHTWLGACYALRLREYEIDHVHVHHGYFGSWIALTAARLLNAGFSMTLHGSDLLLDGNYLATKLEYCKFCLTVSKFNQQYILDHYPGIEPKKIIVSCLGVEICDSIESRLKREESRPFSMLSVGRLHRVKDHAFLVHACAQLHAHGLRFECAIAGDGPERESLEKLIRKNGLENEVTLLGHVPREQMDVLYARADLVVLTSRSEGLPLVLMEAMARCKIVLAPAITGIPELVVDGKNGFLFQPRSQGDFVSRVLLIHSLLAAKTSGHDSFILSSSRRLDWVRHAAQVTVRHHFNGKKNLEAFANVFIRAVNPKGAIHENSLLQQIQLSVQRHGSVPV